MKAKVSLIQICLLSAALFQGFTGEAQTVTKVSAGDKHSLFLMSDGSMWGMGDSFYGELGNVNIIEYPTPDTVPYPEKIIASNVTDIAAGPGYSLLLKAAAVCGAWAITPTANWAMAPT